MNNRRRLVAILFADIAGYTAMMQQDEHHATRILNRYNSQLNENIPKHNGEIIKRYGDGTLILFTSAIDAIHCSLQLQKDFAQDPIVPLRIGIHLGEVTERDNDYFGNDINVCARIESMGVPGCILVSSDVFGKTKNQPDIHTKSLGKFHFKNVEHPLEVYALTNEGLVVPNKKTVVGKFEAKRPFYIRHAKALILLIPVLLALAYFGMNQLNKQTVTDDGSLLLGKKVAILPFENETDDGSLNVLGIMATDWLTQTLINNKAAKVINLPADIKSKENNKVDISEFIEKSEADILVRGRYYLEGDDVYLMSNIVDVSGDVEEVLYSLQSIKGTKNNPISMLNDLQQEMMGYWFLGDVEWVGNNPPKYDAYKLFLSLKDTWISDYSKSEKILKQAFVEDSTFYRPLISLAVLYNNSNQKTKSDSMIQLIESNNYHLSDYEQNRIASIKAGLQGDWNTVAQISDKLYYDYNVYEQGIDACLYHMHTNNPQRVIEIIENSAELGDLGDCYQCQNLFSFWTESYYMLGDYTKVISMTEPIMDQVIDANIAVNHLRALVKLYQMEAVDQALEKYKTMDLEWFGVYNQNLLYWAICQELYLSDKKTSLRSYAQRMLAYAEIHPDNITYEQDMYTSYLFLDQLDSAIVYAGRWSDKWNGYYEPDLIALKSQAGNTAAGDKYLGSVKPPSKYDIGYSEYNQAKVLTALGKKEEAIAALKKSNELGQWFSWYTFQNDIFLKDLLEEDTFKEFVKVKL